MENQDGKNPKPPRTETYSIIGPTTFEALETYTYSVMPADGVEYYWEVDGGNLMSGQGIDTVSIQWTGPVGNLTVNVISGIGVLDTNVGNPPNTGDE